LTEALEAHLHRQIEHSRQFFWQRLRWRVVRQYLPERAPFDLVDVGAGAGLLGEFLHRDCPQADYHFVEPIASLRTFLCDQFGAQADLGDSPDFGECGFVTLLDVLEHQEDDAAFLSDLVGKMRPGSTLLLTVPALQKLWSAWDVKLGHFRRYDKETLTACLDGLPIVVDEINYLFPELVPLGLLRAHRKQKVTEDQSAEFPDIPKPLNELLYLAGTGSVALRRRWGTGTSLFAAATVTA